MGRLVRCVRGVGLTRNHNSTALLTTSVERRVPLPEVEDQACKRSVLLHRSGRSASFMGDLGSAETSCASVHLSVHPVIH